MRIDNEEATDSMTNAINQNAIVPTCNLSVKIFTHSVRSNLLIIPGHLLAEIRDKRKVKTTTETSILTGSVDPSQVSIRAVDGDTENLK